MTRPPRYTPLIQPHVVRMHAAVRALIRSGHIDGKRHTGAISALARWYGVTRQRISQIAIEELADQKSGEP